MNQTNPTNGDKWFAAELLSNDIPALAGFKLAATAFVRRADDGPDLIVFAPDTKAVARLTKPQAGDSLHLNGVAKPAIQTVLEDLFAKAQAKHAALAQTIAPEPQGVSSENL